MILSPYPDVGSVTYNYCSHTLLDVGELYEFFYPKLLDMAPLGQCLDQMEQEGNDCRLRVENNYRNSRPRDAVIQYLYKCVNEGDRAGLALLNLSRIAHMRTCGIILTMEAGAMIRVNRIKGMLGYFRHFFMYTPPEMGSITLPLERHQHAKVESLLCG